MLSSYRPLLRMAPLFRPEKGRLTLCMLGLMLGAALSLVGPWLVARVIDVHLAQNDWPGLRNTAFLYGAVVIATALVTYASRVGLEIVAQRAMKRLKEKVFDHLLGHDLAFHDRHPSGKLITRVQGDTEAMRVLFAEVILAFPADMLLVLGMFGVMAVVAPDMAIYVAAVLPPYALLLVWFRKVAPPRFIAVRKMSAALTGFVSEHLRGMPMLQRFEREAWVRERAESMFEDVYDVEVPASLMPVYFFNSIFMVRNLAMAAILGLGGWQAAQGELTIGLLVLGLGYVRLLFAPMLRLSQHMTTIERARAAAIRLDALLEQLPTIVNAQNALPWPGLKDALEVRDLHFAYEPEAPVLRGVSMRIEAGSRVGIVGATGSGKSTLLNLLMRFRDPIEGSITIDGVDLRSIEVDALRARMGLVLQDIHLIPGSLLDNLGGDPEKARRALDTLGLELSLEAEIDESGGALSRGERQLITFARALLDEPEILILDEATSAIDPETEAEVQAALEKLGRSRTVILVAHRLATVRDCDAIFVMHHGELVERGTHAELMAQAGIYAALYALQQSGGGA